MVPGVFDSHLRLGSDGRRALNALLLRNEIDERLEVMISESDDFVKAPFFWDAAVLPLCTRSRITADYPTLGRATGPGSAPGPHTGHSTHTAHLPSVHC